MPIAAWYRYKAQQCVRLAAEATDPDSRAKFEEEAEQWRELSRDIAKRDRAEGWPP